jgi:ABC-type transport system involved in cytochrome bd biosynthesis fused ATPase/permease subunit
LKKIKVGTQQESGEALTIDVDALIRSKALIQGNSGAGKSGLIRVIVEQIATTVPVIIIDPESEFASLREKLDMVLVGEGGELPADPRSAGLLARKTKGAQQPTYRTQLRRSTITTTFFAGEYARPSRHQEEPSTC